MTTQLSTSTLIELIDGILRELISKNQREGDAEDMADFLEDIDIAFGSYPESSDSRATLRSSVLSAYKIGVPVENAHKAAKEALMALRSLREIAAKHKLS